MPFRSLTELLWNLRILCNAYGLCGLQQVESMYKPGTKVIHADYSQMLAYQCFVTTAAMSFNGSPKEVQAWVLDRESKTRHAARALVADGWPLGEALKEARERQCAVLWNIGGTNVSNTERPQPVDSYMQSLQSGAPPPTGGRPAKPAGESGQPVTVAQCCTAFNDHRGCVRKQKLCPEVKLHRCSAHLPANLGGGLCGAWNHGKSSCPRLLKPGQTQAGGGGKSGGKAGGKGKGANNH
jgi:hypothetical protein